ASNFGTTDDNTYTADITPDGNGDVTIDVASSVAQDGAGNDNSAATQVSVTFDATGPVVTGVSAVTSSPLGVGAQYRFEVTFDETVSGESGLALNVLVGSNARVAQAISQIGNKITFGYTVQSSDQGATTVTLSSFDQTSGRLFDNSGNMANDAISGSFNAGISVDTVAPRLTSIARNSPPMSRTNADSLTFRAAFDEDVQNVDGADFAVSGVTGATISVTAETASAYDVTISGGDLAGFNGVVTLNLVSTPSISDLAGNALTNTALTSSNEGYTVDNAPPEIFSTAINGGPQSAGNSGVGFLVTFTGGGGAANVSPDDFTLTTTGSATGTISSVSAVGSSALQYLVSVSSLGGIGTVRLDLKANTDIADSLGNAGPAVFSTGAVHTVDRQGPTVSSIERRAPSSASTNADNLIFRVTFSENVQNVDQADFTATGVTGASIAVSPFTANIYDVSVSGGDLANFTGTVGLNLVASPTISDFSGNALPNSTVTGSVQTYTLDNAAPVATSISPVGTAPNSASVNYSVVFDTDVANVSADDFTVTTITGAATGTVGPPTGGPRVYTVPITGLTSTGTVRLDLQSGTDITDNLGNGNVVAKTGDGAHFVDLDVPSVTSILRQNPAAEFTDADSLTFRVTFSEDVQNVDLGDFRVGGPTGATIGVTPVSASVYDITVSGGDLAGLNATVSLSLQAGQDIQDLRGNALSNTTPGTAESYVVDNTAPGVTISSTSSGTVTAAFPISVVFSEVVTGFVEAEMVVTGATVTNFMTSDNITFTATLTPTGDGTVTVDVTAGVAQDGAGADNTAAAQFTIGSDVTAPTLTMVGPTGSQTGDFTITINADENVSGFTLGDIVVTNGTPANLTGSSGTSFTVDITNPVIGATVDVTIAAGAVQDDAGNGNAAAASYKVSAGSPVSEFEDNKTEVIDAVQADVRRDLQNDISANQKMMDGAMGRFIDGSNGESAARDVPFDVTGFAEVTGDGLVTQGQFYGFDHLGSGHARYVFGQFDVTRDEGGSTTGQLSGRMVWERPLSDTATMGYFVGARVGQSDIKGAFNGDATTFGVLGGVYAMQRLGKSTFGAGYLGVGQSWSDLSMSNGTLGLSGTYNYTSYYAGLELAGQVPLSTAVDLRPNLAVDYAYAQVGVTGLDATAFGLAAPVSADFGSVWVLESSFTPEIIWSLVQAGAQSTALTFAPSLICREEGGRVGRSNCGGGLELGLKYTSSDGRTRVDATIEGTEVGGTTQERFNLSVERQW
ncbi:MAG: Ig-like domain-containing protein, partial [Pseudomonadota bacterium]